MKGVVIPGTKIIIDSDEPDPEDEYLHFLSCVNLESPYDFAVMKDFKRIYTSAFNKWFLIKFHKFKPERIHCWDEETPKDIPENATDVFMKVQVIDSNYCVGSVMFLFEGTAGNYLYAGNFRYYEKLLDEPCLQKYRYKASDLFVLYLHSPYPVDRCPSFESKNTVMFKIIEFALCYPLDHFIFVSPHIGNEELYVALSQELGVRIYVNSKQLKILKHLKLDQYFTDDDEEARIWVVNVSELKEIQNRSLTFNGSYQIVSLFMEQDLSFLQEEIMHFPYQPYSSREELAHMISAFHPFSVQRIESLHQETTSSKLTEGSLRSGPIQPVQKSETKSSHQIKSSKDAVKTRTLDNPGSQKALKRMSSKECIDRLPHHRKHAKVHENSDRRLQRTFTKVYAADRTALSPIVPPDNKRLKQCDESGKKASKKTVQEYSHKSIVDWINTSPVAPEDMKLGKDPEDDIFASLETFDGRKETVCKDTPESQDKTCAESKSAKYSTNVSKNQEAIRKPEYFWESLRGLDLYEDRSPVAPEDVELGKDSEDDIFASLETSDGRRETVCKDTPESQDKTCAESKSAEYSTNVSKKQEAIRKVQSFWEPMRSSDLGFYDLV
ncbi:unnamed protein product [Bemisia tabaci]|uniref:DNA repair metallo-beta-lactamase domain-containing protein n=1 Tax=Bemisia tabaci TaxID=7038 RepID=A0A9P0AR23_BEMTA|nr:unnamed protein product [Bemisia tabaci]